MTTEEVPEFRSFHPQEQVRIYVRNLPHWRQAGTTYFVTFAQDDAIPVSVMRAWQSDREAWYRAHGVDSRSLDSVAQFGAIDAAIRIAFERQQRNRFFLELDACHGSCLFRAPAHREILEKALNYFDGERYWLGDFVIMPNHAHLLITPRCERVQPIPADRERITPASERLVETYRLEDLCASLKRWVSRRVREALNESDISNLRDTPSKKRNQLWQHESYDHIVRDQEELFEYRYYISQNPVTAGLPNDHFTLHRAKWLDAFTPSATECSASPFQGD